MSDRFEIPGQEHGVVRVFALDLPDSQLPPFVDDDGVIQEGPLQDLLGCRSIDNEYVEFITLDDLAGLGLSGYLIEGLGVAETDIARDRAKLDAIKGHVLVILSPAFGGFAGSIVAPAPLRWIGTYFEEQAREDPKALYAEGAYGQSVHPEQRASKPRSSDAAMSGRVAMVALLVMFALMGMMIWIAG